MSTLEQALERREHMAVNESGKLPVCVFYDDGYKIWKINWNAPATNPFVQIASGLMGADQVASFLAEYDDTIDQTAWVSDVSHSAVHAWVQRHK